MTASISNRMQSIGSSCCFSCMMGRDDADFTHDWRSEIPIAQRIPTGFPPSTTIVGPVTLSIRQKSTTILADVISAPCSSEDRQITGALRHCVRHTLSHAGSFNESRRNAVNGHIGCHCDGQTMGEMNQRRLAGQRGYCYCPRRDAGERRNIYDAAAPCFAEVPVRTP